jgi:hypothetical protein
MRYSLDYHTCDLNPNIHQTINFTIILTLKIKGRFYIQVTMKNTKDPNFGSI